MSDLDMMEERRLIKTYSTEYRIIQNNITRKKKEAKEKEKEEQCETMMTSMCIGKSGKLLDDFERKTYGKLVDLDGKIIVTIDEKKHVWKTYLENLFHDIRAEQEPKIGDRTGPDILLDKVESAIKQLKESR